MKQYVYHPNNSVTDVGKPSLTPTEVRALLSAGQIVYGIAADGSTNIHHVQKWYGDYGTYCVEPMARSLAGVIPAGAYVVGIVQDRGPAALVLLASGEYVSMLGGSARTIQSGAGS